MLYIYLFIYLTYLFTSFNACINALPTPSTKDIGIITERRIDNIITQYKPTEEAVNKWYFLILFYLDVFILFNQLIGQVHLIM